MAQEVQEKGNLSINSENFLPIIKKWLYTDKDIFVRELVSNGCDAVTKLKKLMVMGSADNVPEDEKFEIHVVIDKKNNVLRFEDNGIGMTADEIRKYINQIAFSGAQDFMEKYKNIEENGGDIIGHFGLGFYSAFMVADRVEIDSLSYMEGAEAAHWTCDGGIEYEISQGERTERGTTVILHLMDEEKSFMNQYPILMAIKKYASFMPVEIYLDVVEEEDVLDEKKEGEEAEKPEPINDIHPLWLKNPNECTDEEYKAFYHKVFPDVNDPLFWIHLNMDYPYRLKGILYFPKYISNLQTIEGTVKLFSNQVFIANNIKEVIPEFLLLLKGVIDCDDLPLNVSRSQLQNDGYAKRMSEYITKKVADKLNQLFKNDRENYQTFWKDIQLFVKYGCMKEAKFYKRVKNSIIYELTEGGFVTVPEYLEQNKEKTGDKIFFVSDKKQQVQYLNLFEAEGITTMLMEDPIDKPFINFIENEGQGEYRFLRVDADISDALKVEGKEETEEEKEAQKKLDSEYEVLFRTILGDKALAVKAENLKTKDIAAVLLLSEESRRVDEIRQSFENNDPILEMLKGSNPERTLVLNKTHHLVELLEKIKGNPDRFEETKLICLQLYDLALMAHTPLTSEQMSSFIERSTKVLEKMASFL
ncbi:MAG: molecular chaperone HtpG [Firmicutes bacterium]|nr:molecular chaperone HtpG [Bacillota bacterium]